MGMVAQTCNPSTGEAEAGELPGCHSDMEFGLGYSMRPCFWKLQTENESKASKVKRDYSMHFSKAASSP